MKKKREPTRKSDLSYFQRKQIAEEMKSGLMVKQAAGMHRITLAYAYKIFYEFLEWKAEWKHKETVE